MTAATLGKVLDVMEKQLGIVKEITGQKRNRVYAYNAYIQIFKSGIRMASNISFECS
ncbi:MAG: hypothetical protein GY694_02885 [Gammaproteobacteria bacterium]|nr:hypothetical protein [Gammaproteobacteria bacterium]